MPKQNPMETLRRDPKAAALLNDENSLKKLLESQESKTLMSIFQQIDGASLQQAAQAAMGGDPTALDGILRRVASDPQGATALKNIEKRTK